MRTGVADNEWNIETTTWPAVVWPRLGDERLARLAARGSQRAFAAVYERYHQVLYRYCRSILRDDADAQDALQSTFTRALSALKRGQRSAPLRPWLFRIAHNEAISVMRRRGRGEESLVDASLPSAASAEDQAGERARMAVLLSDLGALPERARSALVMRELSGLSHEEIALALETTPGAAKQAIFEARRGLQECAEGRAMPCVDVCQAISDGDRRLLRGRRVRAHLRDCASCAAFASAIGARQSDLRALVPVLPAAASAAVLSRTLHTAVSHAGAGGGAAAAGAAGKTIGVAFTSKGFATASVLATAAVSVGGVAAVVRLAPDVARLHKAHPARSAPAGAAHHARSAAHHASVSRSSSAPRAGVSSVSPTRRNTHTGAATSHVRFTGRHGHEHGHGHGGPVAWHRTTLAANGAFAHGGGGRGDAGSHRGWQHTTGHDSPAAPAVRHDTLEAYARGQGHHGALGSDQHGNGHHGEIGNHGSGQSGHADLASTPTSDGNHFGRNK
jgi:RNA polymerase sigma factor (sigma-70 family)